MPHQMLHDFSGILFCRRLAVAADNRKPLRDRPLSQLSRDPRARGLRVFGTAGTDQGRKLVREQRAEEVFDHHAPDHFEQIMKATSGRGVDVIVELLANVNLAKDLTILAKGGRVVIIGSRGRVEIDPRDTMQRDADIRGMVLPNTPAAEMTDIHAALVAGLGDGTLRPVIGKELPLAEAPEAHRAVMEPGAFGKIVLII